MTNSRDVNEKAGLLQQSHPKGFRVQGSIFLGSRVEDFLESRFGSFGVFWFRIIVPPCCVHWRATQLLTQLSALVHGHGEA